MSSEVLLSTTSVESNVFNNDSMISCLIYPSTLTSRCISDISVYQYIYGNLIIIIIIAPKDYVKTLIWFFGGFGVQKCFTEI